jgi:predicted PurR-regulated permease PerM
MTPGTRRTLIRVTAGLAFVLVLIWLMAALESVTTVVMVAFFLAYVLNPATGRLESWGLSRPVAAFIMLLACISIVVGLLIVLVPATLGEVTRFAREAPRYFSALHALALEAARKLEITGPADWGQITDLVAAKGQEYLPKLAKSAAGLLSSVLASVFRSALTILSALVHIFLVPIIAYYLLVSFEDIRRGIVDLIPPYTRDPVLAKLREIDLVLANFVRGQLTVAGILAGLYTLGFLVMGLDLAIVLGILSGLLWIVPYLGTVIAITGGSAMALAQYGDIRHVLYVLIWIAGVQLGESYLLTPRLVGHAVGLHPVVYILAVVVGANLFGFVGMLVAIPVTAVLKVLLMTAADVYRESSLYGDSPGERTTE